MLREGVFHARRDLVTREGQRIIIVRLRSLNWSVFDTYAFLCAFLFFLTQPLFLLLQLAATSPFSLLLRR